METSPDPKLKTVPETQLRGEPDHGYPKRRRCWCFWGPRRCSPTRTECSDTGRYAEIASAAQLATSVPVVASPGKYPVAAVREIVTWTRAAVGPNICTLVTLVTPAQKVNVVTPGVQVCTGPPMSSRRFHPG